MKRTSFGVKPGISSQNCANNQPKTPLSTHFGYILGLSKMHASEMPCYGNMKTYREYHAMINKIEFSVRYFTANAGLSLLIENIIPYYNH